MDLEAECCQPAFAPQPRQSDSRGTLRYPEDLKQRHQRDQPGRTTAVAEIVAEEVKTFERGRILIPSVILHDFSTLTGTPSLGVMRPTQANSGQSRREDLPAEALGSGHRKADCPPRSRSQSAMTCLFRV